MTLEISSVWKSTDACLCHLSTDNDLNDLNVKLNETYDERDVSNSKSCGPYLKVESSDAAPFHVCPYVAVQGVTVRRISSISLFYSAYSAASPSPPPIEIWLTGEMASNTARH